MTVRPLNKFLVFFIALTSALYLEICLGQDYLSFLKSREESQSPFGSQYAANTFNEPLNSRSSVAGKNSGASAIKFAALTQEYSERWIKEKCRKTPINQQRCYDNFGGDPMAVLAIEQTLLTDDLLARDENFFSQIGIGSAQRQEFLEKTSLAFRDNEFKEGDDSPKNILRARIKTLAGENRIVQLDNSPHIPPFNNLQNTNNKLNSDLDKLRDFIQGPFYPDKLEGNTNKILDKIQRADDAVKSALRNLATTNLRFFANAESAAKFAKKAADFLDASERDKKNISKLVKVTEQANKTVGVFLTLGRASSGDITAYIQAAGALSSIFGGDGSGPSFESQVMETLNQVLKNQQKIIERLDFINFQLNRVSHQLEDIYSDIIMIGENVGLLLEGQRELLSKDFLLCMQHKETILTNDKVKEALNHFPFDPFVYPYNENIYQIIVEAGVTLHKDHNWVGSCWDGFFEIFKGMNVGPSEVFRQERTKNNEGIKDYHSKLAQYIDLFRKTFPNLAISKIGNTELRVLASIPATKLQTVDEKITHNHKSYSFGTSDKEKLEEFIKKSYDPYRLSVFQIQMYETLPYVWIHSKEQPGCKGNTCEGLPQFAPDNYIEAILNSLHFNLFLSANEALLQGDVLLPMLYEVFNVAPKESTEEQKFLKDLGYELLSFNVILRENFLRYLVFKSYASYPRSAFRLHYYYLNNLEELNSTFGPIWTFEKKAIIPENNPQNLVLHIKMPCKRKMGDNQFESCSYPVPNPNIYGLINEYMHSMPTKELTRARAQGNRLLSVIQAYHPENERVKGAGL